ncbi:MULTISPECIES: IclR family transcriptional regulator [unclassified Caballeronia]|uniref:IclR family transcriptional regulator n=1 Tax=unclassified Caballeronia TaxID=2646786 RepID=UPI002862666C|nr:MULTISPECIES: IclR family transcriptional regulator [unclassified Caballeronia]MDR5815090.1 IclR family transcriptional regulator [Caballeronia sp. LZ033]MDR5879782.1 IclR family transcriptional regulator [Caballeronia sp. LZ032]
MSKIPYQATPIDAADPAASRASEDTRAKAADSAAEPGRGAGVKSALRVLTILEFFATTRRPATLAQIARQLEWPKSSLLALLETLRQEGYLYWLGRDDGYYPTRRCLDLGQAITGHDPILAAARPFLARICEETDETAILAKREGLEVLYLEVVEPSRALRYSARPGQLKPIHSGASGRALLALMSAETRGELIQRLERRRFSDQTLVDPQDIANAVEIGSARGWHVAVNEYQAETTSIAAGFRFGAEDYAFVVAAPNARVLEREEEIGAIVAAQAADMYRRYAR